MWGKFPLFATNQMTHLDFQKEPEMFLIKFFYKVVGNWMERLLMLFM